MDPAAMATPYGIGSSTMKAWGSEGRIGAGSNMTTYGNWDRMNIIIRARTPPEIATNPTWNGTSSRPAHSAPAATV